MDEYYDAATRRRRIQRAAEYVGRGYGDEIRLRVMTANHLPPQWRGGLDGQALVEVFTNVSELRRIERGRA